MKKFVFLIVALLLLIMTNAVYAQDFTEYGNAIKNLTTANLQGSVALVEYISYYTTEENGEITKGNIESYHQFEYNNNGDLIRNNTIHYTLNKEGMILESNNLRSPDVRKGDRVEFLYDHNSKCVAKKYYRDKDVPIFQSKCLTDEKGNIIKEIMTDVVSSSNTTAHTSVLTFTYNSAGIITSSEEKSAKSGNIYMSKTLKLDERGNVVKIIDFDDVAGKSEFTFKYTKYDNHGNWIECIQDNVHQGKTLITRKIKYAK